MWLRIVGYVALGLVLLAVLDPRNVSEPDPSSFDGGGVLLGTGLIATWAVTLGVLAVVVLVVEGLVRHRARRREGSTPTEDAPVSWFD
jgi:hypothetical protein